ncbi:MAG: hypothetical protein H6983_21140 [Ectothiorhodospiraceae bacterium]|nr:hypothetical protein [Ectothiorhodospiraceae bacterium]
MVPVPQRLDGRRDCRRTSHGGWSTLAGLLVTASGLLGALTPHPALAQVGCQHLGNTVQCPAGVSDGAFSLNFVNGGLSILWSDNAITLTAGCCDLFLPPVLDRPIGGVPELANRDVPLLPLAPAGAESPADGLLGPIGSGAFLVVPYDGTFTNHPAANGPIDFSQGPYTLACFDGGAGGRCGFDGDRDDTRQATQRTAEAERLEQATNAVAAAERERDRQLAAIQTQLAEAEHRLAYHEGQLAIFEANLASHRRDESVLETVSVWLGGDARATRLEIRIAAARSLVEEAARDVAAYRSALRNTLANFESLLHRLRLAVILAQTETREREQARRYQTLVELNQEFHTRRLGFVAGYESFERMLADLDTQIAQSRASGFEDAARIFAERRAKVVEALELWMAFQQNFIAAAGLDLHRAYQVNANEAVGPRDFQQLVSQVLAHGGTIESTLEQVDQARVDATARSAARIAAGAPDNVDHANIFDNPLDADAWAAFATDYRETFRDYLRDPGLFFSRYLAYARGVGLAIKDGVLDLVVLGWEIVDTGLEATQRAYNVYTGDSLNIVGDENLATLERVGSAASELDSEAIYVGTQSFLGWLDRRYARAAATGERGLESVLQDTGYVVTTVLGGEEIAFRAVAAGARGVRIVRLGRVVNRTGDGVTVARAAENVAEATVDASRAARAGNAAEEGVGAAAVAGRANAASPPLRVPDIDPRRVGMTELPDGRVLLEADGHRLLLTPRELLGEGSTSIVYSNPDFPDVVIKITKPGSGSALDDFGYNVIKTLDSTKVEIPTIHRRMNVDAPGSGFDGGVVTIVERGPTGFKDSPFRAADEVLTDGQRAAYEAGIRELNDNGYVLLDNHHGNWDLRPLDPSNPNADRWVLVVIDPGGLVPVKNLDPGSATALQRAIDAPPPELLARIGDLQWVVNNRGLEQFKGRGVFHEYLAENFDGVVDWVSYNAATGGEFSTLGRGWSDNFGAVAPDGWIPFNPRNGIAYPQLGSPAPVAPAGLASAATPSGAGLGSLDEAMHLDDPDIGAMSDQEFANYLHRTDPAYWTPERIAEYIDATPEPIRFADDAPSTASATTPTASTSAALGRAAARSGLRATRRAGEREDRSGSGPIAGLGGAVVDADARAAGVPSVMSSGR